MNNKLFKIGDGIVVYGNRGIIENITNCKEYKILYNGKEIGNGLEVFTDEVAADCISRGYTLEPTGRTATYFDVNFDSNAELKNTAYNHGTFGCLDEFECYSTF